MTIRWGDVFGRGWPLWSYEGDPVSHWAVPAEVPLELLPRRRKLHGYHCLAVHGLFHLLRGRGW